MIFEFIWFWLLVNVCELFGFGNYFCWIGFLCFSWVIFLLYIFSYRVGDDLKSIMEFWWKLLVGNCCFSMWGRDVKFEVKERV